MKNIILPTFTDADIYVIENIDKEKLKSFIDFLRDYKTVLWKNGDTGELMPLCELKKHNVRIQPLPVYPEELLQIGATFYNMMKEKPEFSVDLREEGFFCRNSIASYCMGTMYSPAVIASLISDAFKRERFCDGLLGFGIDNGLYLKMFLHLNDLIIYYNYLNRQQEQGDGSAV